MFCYASDFRNYRIMGATTELENDNYFLYMAHQMKGIQPLLKSFFGFLERKTDFYEATPEKAEFMILNVYREFAYIHQEKKKKKAGAGECETCGGDSDKFVKIPKVENAVIEELEPEKKDYKSEYKKLDELKTEDKKDDVIVEEIMPEMIPEMTPQVLLQECKAKSSKPKKEVKRVNWEISRLTKKGSAYPNEGDGASYPGYKWTQTTTELEVQIPLYDYSDRVRSNLEVFYDRRSIKVCSIILEEELIFGGEIYAGIKSSELTWTVEDQLLIIRTEKLKAEWWKKLLLAEPNLLINKVLKEHATIGDIDEATKREFQNTIMRKKEYSERMHKEQFPDRVPLPDHLKDQPDSPMTPEERAQVDNMNKLNPPN